MAKRVEHKVSAEDAITLALFAQRSPNAEFREQAFALALAALADGAAELANVRPLCEFAARTKAKTPSAEQARTAGARLLRESGHAELLTQLSQSAPPVAPARAKPRRKP
jgi:hypothetical protein